MIAPENHYQGKKVVVLGLGRSGIAAARLLLRCGALVSVCDSGQSQALKERASMLRDEGSIVITGTDAESDETNYDLAILSPGIEETTALVKNVTAKGIPLIGELELAFSLCSCPVIAITGTNGKTTTTELTSRMLAGAGLRNTVCGNIGTPMSEVLAASEDWDLLVVEVSSFQLETIQTFRPKIALWLNLSPNHLDRYPSMVEYRNAKLRIFENQSKEDWAIIPFHEELPPLQARKITFSIDSPDADLSLKGNEICYHGNRILNFTQTKLAGPHNAANLMAALGCGIALQADLTKMIAAISDYKPPAHRCELIAEIEGVRWINDSKATNLNALEQAVRSIEGPLLLIAGGKDKGFEFAPLASLIQERVSSVILIGEMKNRIAKDWHLGDTTLVDSLEEAVDLAAQKAAPGTTVLFSPGTSSFDMFRDYIERGECFRRCVGALLENALPSSL